MGTVALKPQAPAFLHSAFPLLDFSLHYPASNVPLRITAATEK
jgi:hypothetical protein